MARRARAVSRRTAGLEPPLILLVQACVPVLTLYLTRVTLDGVTARLEGEPVSITLLATFWALTLLIDVVLSPISSVLQGNVGEKFTAYINLKLMDKADTLVGLETRLGKAFGGTELSGGQWQKLALSRALYRHADLLILDEPTAALDPRSEADIFRQFIALAEGKSALVIIHRLGSVLSADRILVLKAGQLIEQGTHQDLIAQTGEYAELWQLQAAQYREMSL